MAVRQQEFDLTKKSPGGTFAAVHCGEGKGGQRKQQPEQQKQESAAPPQKSKRMPKRREVVYALYDDEDDGENFSTYRAKVKSTKADGSLVLKYTVDGSEEVIPVWEIAGRIFHGLDARLGHIRHGH